MIIHNRNITARQAAEEFAATFQEQPRKVGTFLGKPARFKLVDGNRWYQVRCLNDYSGMEVVPEGQESDRSFVM